MKWYEKQKKLFTEKYDLKENVEEIDSSNLDDGFAKEILEDTDNNILVENDQLLDESMKSCGYEEELVIDKKPLDPVYQESIIGDSTMITGDIETKGDLCIHGTLLGNVKCGGNLKVSGKVLGDIEMKNGDFNSANIEGNIYCQETFIIGHDAKIKGEIIAQTLTSDGMIKGNVTVSDFVRINGSCVIEGDVSSQQVEIQKGAILKGCFTVIEKHG